MSDCSAERVLAIGEDCTVILNYFFYPNIGYPSPNALDSTADKPANPINKTKKDSMMFSIEKFFQD